MAPYTVWRTLDGHNQIVNFAAFSTSGELLATGDDGGNVLIWSLVNGNLFQSLPRNGPEAVSCCWGDDKELFVGYGDGDVHFFEHGRLHNRFERTSSIQVNQQKRHVSSLAIQGNLLACSSGNGVHCLRIEKPLLRLLFNVYMDVREVRAVHFVDRYTILATAIHEGQCVLVDVLNPSKSLWRRKLRYRIGESALSSDGKYLSITNLAAAVQVYEVTPTGLKLLRDFTSPMSTSSNFPLQTCFAEHQTMVAAGSDDGEVRLWNLDTGVKTSLVHGQAKYRPPQENPKIRLVQTVTAWSSVDHHYLASACGNGYNVHTVRVWRRACKDNARPFGLIIAAIAFVATVLFVVIKRHLYPDTAERIAAGVMLWWHTPADVGARGIGIPRNDHDNTTV